MITVQESGTAYPMQSNQARARTGDGYVTNPRRKMIPNNNMVMYGENVNSGRNFTADKYGSSQYAGPSYSVKYLGIVDGSMGVLSRKMALLNYN